MNNYFGPLSKKACIVFYILAVICGLLFTFTVIFMLIFIFKNYKNLNYMFFINSFAMLFNLFLAYFTNRLLHTMCVNSLK